MQDGMFLGRPPAPQHARLAKSSSVRYCMATWHAYSKRVQKSMWGKPPPQTLPLALAACAARNIEKLGLRLQRLDLLFV